MNQQNSDPVVVGVGHDPIDAALEFAAGVATRAGCGLRLVHVAHLVAHGSEVTLAAETAVEKAGRQALDAALELAHEKVPGVPVTAELLVGPVVPTLIEASGSARLIVLQHRKLSAVKRVVTRSISSGVAAQARMPVVCVPSQASSSDAYGGRPTVVVGVDAPERARFVLQAAAGEARSREAALLVLHTWRMTSAYDDRILGRMEDEEMTARATAGVEAALEERGDEVAGLPVQVEVAHGYAADVLIEASRGAELLVIGRHDPLVPVGSHLGPIARAVLREAECPILLVDPRPSGRWYRRPERTAEHGSPTPV